MKLLSWSLTLNSVCQTKQPSSRASSASSSKTWLPSKITGQPIHIYGSISDQKYRKTLNKNSSSFSNKILLYALRPSSAKLLGWLVVWQPTLYIKIQVDGPNFLSWFLILCRKTLSVLSTFWKVSSKKNLRGSRK